MRLYLDMSLLVASIVLVFCGEDRYHDKKCVCVCVWVCVCVCVWREGRGDECIPSSSRHCWRSQCVVCLLHHCCWAVCIHISRHVHEQKFVYVTYTAIHSVMRETHLKIVAEHRFSYLLAEDIQMIILTSCESETFKHQMWIQDNWGEHERVPH